MRAAFRVHGAVQGVGYRRFAEREARALDLAGWVRNEPDGSVAAYVEGPDDAVAEMVAWCRHGPPAAAVDRVEVADVTATGAPSFEVDH